MQLYKILDIFLLLTYIHFSKISGERKPTDAYPRHNYVLSSTVSKILRADLFPVHSLPAYLPSTFFVERGGSGETLSKSCTPDV